MAVGNASQLGIDKADVRRARTLARQVGKPIVDLAQRLDHSAEHDIHHTLDLRMGQMRVLGRELLDQLGFDHAGPRPVQPVPGSYGCI